MKLSWSVLSLSVLTIGCSLQQSVSKLATALDPRPSDLSTIEAQLKRFEGQTKFLNIYSRSFGPVVADASRDTKKEGAARDVQESDLFKVGKPGSKILYLLNQYRGLQVVSYEDGIERPKLVGRAEASGNFPNDMYFDAANSRIIVLEDYWISKGGQSETRTRVLAYDVSDSTNPRLAQTLEVEGALADSRLVGDVLYVASSIHRWGQNQKSEGKVVSFKVTGESISQIEELKLSLPVSRAENMGIITQGEGENTKYYLTAVLANDGWGWWGTKSTIEVIDITSEKGDIRPIMRVPAKGFVRERSQLSIRDGFLVAASNYQTSDRVGRVAVETFALPTESSEILTADEAEFRRLHIERELKKVPEGEREALLEKLLADKELGLKGRFIKQGDELTKASPDSTVTVGDTQGLSADLRDVRFDGDKLYVFWVPRNQIDPLDVFDLSNLKNGTPYLGRLQFEGWIERAHPITYKGHRFILGLGWVVPAVNNENNRRVPQAALFEVKDRASGVKLEQIATLNLENSNVWTDFSAADKFIEFRENEDGTGSIMFAVSSWESGRIQSGAKLVGFDLNKAIADEDGSLVEGGFLNASSGWLRRVFSNSEINKVNTFSNTKLGTFDVSPRTVGAATDVYKAVSTLELARNIVSYEQLSDVGVQIIADNEDGWGVDSKNAVVLRSVSVKAPDAEKPAAISELTLSGNYVSHLVTAQKSQLFVVTSQGRYEGEGERRIYVSDYHLYKVVLSEGSKLESLGSVKWQGGDESLGDEVFFSRRPVLYPYWNPAELIELPSGEVILKRGNIVERVTGSTKPELAKLTFENCNFTQWHQPRLKVIAGSPVVEFADTFTHPTKPTLELARNFVVRIKAGEGQWACEAPINVAGRVLSILPHAIVTEDDRLLAITEHKSVWRERTEIYHTPVTERVLVSHNIQNDSAELRDLYAQGGGYEPIHTLGSEFLMVKSPSEYSSRTQLHKVALADNGRFTQMVAALQSDLEGNFSISALLPTRTVGEFIILASHGNQYRVYELKAASMEIRKLSFQQNGDPAELDKATVLGFGWYSDASDRVHFDEARNTIEIAGGLFGVTQLKLVR